MNTAPSTIRLIPVIISRRTRTTMRMRRVQARIRRQPPRRLLAAMNWAASRTICFAIILIAPFCVHGAEAAGRAAPSRPAAGSPPVPSSPLVTKKIGGSEYVSVASVAVRLGLKAMWLERGKRVALVGPAGRAELENDSRDVTVNGLRVFLGDPVMDARGELYVSRIDFERC